jgi:hypothetical protein
MAYRVPLFSALIAATAVFASAMLLSIRRGYRAAGEQFWLVWGNETVYTVAIIVFGLLPVALALLIALSLP